MVNKQDEDRKMEAIGERLRMTREALGFKQNEFAEKAGIPNNTYNQYEKGKKRPFLENAQKLVDTYGLSLDWIYDGKMGGLPHRLVQSFETNSSQKAS
jgi:transcriptional regulator with XRE-family HTH domain